MQHEENKSNNGFDQAGVAGELDKVSREEGFERDFLPNISARKE